MGHAPLFCDPIFAQFSQVKQETNQTSVMHFCLYIFKIFIQEVGMASLGISDEWIEKLAAVSRDSAAL